MPALLISNCRILVHGKLEERNILVENGKISRIAASSGFRGTGDVFDARGKIAIPGAVDVHVHCREPGSVEKEDFRTASTAAAAGGVTSFFDMPNNKVPVTTVKLLGQKRHLAKKSVVNYGFYIGAARNNFGEIMKTGNVAGVKVYMGSSTGNLLVDDDASLQKVFCSGKKIAVHAESEAMVRNNMQDLHHVRERSAAMTHLRIRNPLSAAVEVDRAVNLARKTKADLHICHLSTSSELELVRRNRGSMRLSCEVTPHHLFLPAEEAARLGNFAKVNPPLRRKTDVAALWEGINSGLVDIVATDHAPHLKEEKHEDYRNAPSGMPGLETMLPLLLDAVSRLRISLPRVVKLVSENPAHIFGARGKGEIAHGYDADIAIIDMDREKTIRNDRLFTKCGWSPFNGRKVRGSVVATFVNGKLVYNDGHIVGSAGKEVVFA